MTLENTCATPVLILTKFVALFLGGANITYIRSLSRVNISMDINTFIGLDSAVVQVCAHPVTIPFINDL